MVKPTKNIKPCGKEVFWHLAISFCFIDETKLKFYIGCLMIDYFLKKQYNNIILIFWG